MNRILIDFSPIFPWIPLLILSIQLCRSKICKTTENEIIRQENEMEL